MGDIKSEIFEEIQSNILTGNSKAVRNYVRKALGSGIDAEEVVEYALLSAMDKVTELYRDNKMFIPDLLVSVKAFDVGMDIVERHYEPDTELVKKGVVVVGTVAGDVHEIGKNLVVMMLKSVGVQVYDLGVDVDAKRFVDEAERVQADVICMSATLTTTMSGMEEVVQRLVRRRIRDKYIVMIGGAPVSDTYAKRIGADYYTADAASAAELAKKVIAERIRLRQSHNPS